MTTQYMFDAATPSEFSPSDFDFRKCPAVKSNYILNALADVNFDTPQGQSYEVYIMKDAPGVWVIDTEDGHGMDGATFAPSFRTLRDAKEAATDFCRHFLECYAENNGLTLVI